LGLFGCRDFSGAVRVCSTRLAPKRLTLRRAAAAPSLITTARV